MNITSNENNNIFKWATKELSQDAIVAWLLADKTTGKLFVQSLLGKNCPDKFKIIDIETQKKSIDILVTIKVDDSYRAIIIEDKTNSFLHDNQILRYIETVSALEYKGEKYQTIYYVLFKTGTVYEWEEKEYKRQRDLIEKIKSNKNKKITIDEINDYYRGTKIIISGTYNNAEINLTDFFNNGGEIIFIDVYKTSNFQKFLNATKRCDCIFSLIKEYYENNEEDKYKEIRETIYRQICKYLKEQKNGYDVRVIIPSGVGKRDYDICIYSADYIKYRKDPKKRGDNYLILPFITFMNKGNELTKVKFSINYSLIADLKNLHGYLPYSKMSKIFPELEWYDQAKKELQMKLQEEVGEDKYLVKKGKNNKLKFISWTEEICDISGGIDIDDNIKKLLGYAEIIKNFLDE